MRYRNIFKMIQYRVNKQYGRFWHYTIDPVNTAEPAHVDVDDIEIDCVMTYDTDSEYFMYLFPIDRSWQ